MAIDPELSMIPALRGNFSSLCVADSAELMTFKLRLGSQQYLGKIAMIAGELTASENSLLCLPL